MHARFAKFAMVIAALALSPVLRADDTPSTSSVRIKDITTIEGVRENPLVGYGLVVGLAGTGDSQQTIFSVQTLANVLQRMGVQIPAASVQVRNVAAVFVTASLPAFSQPGMAIDVTVSSTGDAKSLEGGQLLMTPLIAADGKVYAVAQGPLTLGGYSAGTHGNTKTVNHRNVGRIPDGAEVERGASVDLSSMKKISFLLRDPDFEVSHEIAGAINKNIGSQIAQAIDSRRIDLTLPTSASTSADIASLMARLGEVTVSVEPVARVVVNERTGTVVMGGAVTLGSCSILHGNLAIEVTTQFQVSQPTPLSKGETTTVPETKLQATEAPAQLIQLKQGATVEELVRGLQTMGATAHDIVAILQAIKAAGALQAELEVL
jgi:flagellar P-ring protein FlgI